MINSLLRCQEATHLSEVFTEIKESVIYSKTPQPLIFKACGFYLQFQSDRSVIETSL